MDKAEYRNYVLAGVCVYCRCADAEPGFTVCPTCRKKVAANAKTMRETRKAAGLCVVCGKSVEDGAATCQSCRNWRNWKRRMKRLDEKYAQR